MNIGPGRVEDLTVAHAALSIDIGMRLLWRNCVCASTHLNLEYTLLRNLHRELFGWVYLSDLSTLSDTETLKRWKKGKID